MKRTSFGFIRYVGGDADGRWVDARRTGIEWAWLNTLGAWRLTYRGKDEYRCDSSNGEPVLRLVENFSADA